MKNDEILKIHGETYMENFKLCVPCLLGLEGPIADELRRMRMQDVQNENGRVYFTGGAREIARANINLRIGERVLLELGRFRAETFDELFEHTKALPWEMLIPKDAAFPVKGYSLNSKLFSVSDCQKIIKKAIVERLKSVYGIEWFSETAETYQIQFSIMKDVASLCIDTSGSGLHKRGYRPAHNAAPGNDGRSHGKHFTLSRQGGLLRSLLRQRNHTHRGSAYRQKSLSRPEPRVFGHAMAKPRPLSLAA